MESPNETDEYAEYRRPADRPWPSDVLDYIRTQHREAIKRRAVERKVARVKKERRDRNR